MAKHFSKNTETRDELSTTLYLQSKIIKVMSRCLSVPCYIPTSLPQEQAAKTKMLSVVWIQQNDYAQLRRVHASALHKIIYIPNT